MSKLRFLFLINIFMATSLISQAHATEFKGRRRSQWSYQAFSPEDKAIIEEVLKSEGDKGLIKVNSLPNEAKLVLDDVDAILYDCGFFDVLKKRDALERTMLVRQAQIGPLSKLRNKYKDLDQRKLQKLYDLFLHD